MMRIQRLGISKLTALFLVFLLLGFDFTVYSSGNPETRFDTALKLYREKAYKNAVQELEGILEWEDTGSKARVYLLLGACYEKLGQFEKAKDIFLRLKEMVEQRTIDQPPIVTGVNADSLKTYEEVFQGKTFFNHKEPVPVSEVMKKNIVHAPRKSLEEKEKMKKRKKFPWLIAVGAVVVVGTAVILLFKQKKDTKWEFRDVEWVYIPAGEFLMGDNFNEGDADELPVHPVYLDGYYISEQEIGIDQYNHFCRETGRQELNVNIGAVGVNYPAYGVSWVDAAAFCEWLSARTGRNIHLPTEAQWEKAARGTYQYRYPWGNSEPTCDKAKLRGCPSFTYDFQHTKYHTAGKSPYGVFAMAGNLKEWCRDWYGASYYAVSAKNNPNGPASGSFRVLRGGGYDSVALDIRSAKREYADPKLNSGQVGLRIVMEEN